MKLINKTHWKTEDLKKVIHLALQTMAKMDQIKRLRIIVEYGRYSGYAPLNSKTFWIYIPKDSIDVSILGWLSRHEFLHCAGQSHEDMQGGYYHSWSNFISDKKAMNFLKILKVRKNGKSV